MSAACALLLAAGAVANPEATHSHAHTHAHDEIDEEQGPVLFVVTYTGEVMANVSGGKTRGAQYLDNLDIVLEADLDRLVSLPKTELHLYGLYNNGVSISGQVGDSFAVSNIEADGGNIFRLYEALINTQVTPSTSVKVGLYDLNSEFDSLESAELFVGSAHGIGIDISQTGINGPSIFPETSFAVRLEKQFGFGVKIRAALLDGVPGDPENPGRTTIRFGKNVGFLGVTELELPVGNGRVLAGHWRYTARFDQLGGGSGRGNAGYYLRGETPLIETGETRVDIFSRLGTASGRFNMFSSFASAGIKITGLLASTSDEAGIAFAIAGTSRHYRAATSAERYEAAMELTYRRQILAWLSVQPNLQFIFNPSAERYLPHAIVAGIRTELAIRF